MPLIDLLGLGVVAVDDLLFVDAYPPPDTKTTVQRRERHCGGLTATALVAAARLGAHCAYATTLGHDALSEYVVQILEHEGIDLTHLRRADHAAPAHSTIVLDQTAHTRTIFVDLHGVVGASLDWPPDDVIQACRVLFLDHFGLPGMVRAAHLARAAGIPIVADIEKQIPEVQRLMTLVDHLILSWDFARQLTHADSPEQAARDLWRADRQAVVVTDGERGCWYLSPEAPTHAIHHPAFRVEVVDTNGCGDVFHGAYAAGLVRGLPLPERIRLASAAAALKATRPGGQTGAPTWNEVQSFLSQKT